MKTNVYKIIVILIVTIFLSKIGLSQVAINDDGASPNSNSILDINVSTNDKGILIPRLTTAQRTAMSLVAGDEGLTVYDKTNHRFYYWNGSTLAWEELTTQGANWSILGNTGINAATNFLGTTDAQPLIFKTNGTERARFLSDGKLGVNTTSPDVYFHIYGNDNVGTGGKVSDDATYSNGTGLFVLGDMSGRNLVFDQNEILARNNGSASSLYLQNRGGDIRVHYDRPTTTHDDGTQFIIKDDGKVGIGFLAPEDMLHIYNNMPYIKFTDTDGGSKWRMGVNGGSTRFQIGDYSGATFNSFRFVIKETGYVGIGTNVPEGMLHVKGENDADATILIDADRGDNNTDTWKISSIATGNDLEFINHTNTRFTIEADGDIGIGTTSPAKVLHIRNSIPYIRYDDTDGGNYWETGLTGGDFRIYEAGNIQMSIEAGGNVDINHELNVDGDTYLNGGAMIGDDSGDAILVGGTATFYETVTLGDDGAGGQLDFFSEQGATDYTLSLKPSNSMGGDYTFTFPAGDGSNGQVLSTNGSGVLSWVAAGGAGSSDFSNNGDNATADRTIGNNDNFDLGIETNGTTRIHVQNDGNIGIGTTSPSEVLEVNGAVLLGTTANTNTGAIRWSGTNFEGYDGSNWVSLTASGGNWTLSGSNVYRNTGNVGINVTSPAEKLDVDGNIKLTGEVNRTTQGSADLLPIAYGIVNSNASTANPGTGNWSAVWNGGSTRYEITITGENFSINNYIVTANNIGGPAMSISYGSGSNKLYIYPKNSSGSTVQDNFSFVVYKP